MTYTINEEIAKKEGLELAELFAILLVKTGANIPKLFEDMLKKEILVKDLFNDFMVTQRWDDVCSTILLKAEDNIPTDEELNNLAKKMMEFFPTGKRAGTTSTYWRGNIKDVRLKLQKFFKLYGNHWSNDEILKATEKYVKSFNGDYKYMRVLKHFIWKDERKINSEGNGYVEEVSDLATLLENDSNINMGNEIGELL